MYHKPELSSAKDYDAFNTVILLGVMAVYLWRSPCSLFTPHNRHRNLSLPPAVELAEENALPAAEE